MTCDVTFVGKDKCSRSANGNRFWVLTKKQQGFIIKRNKGVLISAVGVRRLKDVFFNAQTRAEKYAAKAAHGPENFIEA